MIGSGDYVITSIQADTSNNPTTATISKFEISPKKIAQEEDDLSQLKIVNNNSDVQLYEVTLPSDSESTIITCDDRSSYISCKISISSESKKETEEDTLSQIIADINAYQPTIETPDGSQLDHSRDSPTPSVYSALYKALLAASQKGVAITSISSTSESTVKTPEPFEISVETSSCTLKPNPSTRKILVAASDKEASLRLTDTNLIEFFTNLKAKTGSYAVKSGSYSSIKFSCSTIAEIKEQSESESVIVSYGNNVTYQIAKKSNDNLDERKKNVYQQCSRIHSLIDKCLQSQNLNNTPKKFPENMNRRINKLQAYQWFFLLFVCNFVIWLLFATAVFSVLDYFYPINNNQITPT